MQDNNKNYSEFDSADESISQSEFTSFQEEISFYSEHNESCEEYVEFSEDGSFQEGGSTRVSASKTSSSTSSKITTGVVAAVGVGLIAISVISGNATFTQFDIYGTCVDYTLETTIEYVMDDTTIMDYDNLDTNLRIITYSDQTDQTDLVLLATNNQELSCEVEVISSGSDGGEIKVTFDGMIDGLFEGTSYTTQVVGIDSSGDMTVYLTKNFTTTGSQSLVKEIEWECKCRIDGCFYFAINYIDENGYYQDFYYKLISASTGEVFSEGEMQNPTQTQCVNVENAEGMDYILEISFVSIAPIDIANGETNKVYSLDVQI